MHVRFILDYGKKLKEWILLLPSQLKNYLQNFNLFTRRNSDAFAVREQVLTTRIYIGFLLISLLVLIIVTGLDQRALITTVLLPSTTEFEKLFQTQRHTLSCPCSQIAIPNSAFMSTVPKLHQICSSDLLSDDVLDRLSYLDNNRHKYYYLDVRLYGLDMFRTIISYCMLSNNTINDALTNFLNAYLISTEVLSRRDFSEQTQMIIKNFESNVKKNFKQMSDLAHDITRGNQVLSSRILNSFLDGVFDSNDYLIKLQTYLGTMSSISDVLPTCSCIINSCSQPLGFFDPISNGTGFVLIAEIPGMYSGCYPLDGLRASTFECWFNVTCISLIVSHLTLFPVDIPFKPLNANELIHFSPTTTLGDIIDEIMVEEWIYTINYDAYYKSCNPLKCVYTYSQRLDFIYIITILGAVFGGLSVSLRIICPFLIKIFVSRRHRIGIAAESKYMFYT